MILVTNGTYLNLLSIICEHGRGQAQCRPTSLTLTVTCPSHALEVR